MRQLASSDTKIVLISAPSSLPQKSQFRLLCKALHKRRNFLFTGSVRGGERLAVAYTLVDNCLILDIDPRRYLQDTIDKLERGHALSRMSELTPASWAANQSR
jgi:hypothetical protein